MIYRSMSADQMMFGSVSTTYQDSAVHFPPIASGELSSLPRISTPVSTGTGNGGVLVRFYAWTE